MMPIVVAPGQPQTYARVIKTEEKGSDVNLATHLLLILKILLQTYQWNIKHS